MRRMRSARTRSGFDWWGPFAAFLLVMISACGSQRSGSDFDALYGGTTDGAGNTSMGGPEGARTSAAAGSTDFGAEVGSGAAEVGSPGDPAGPAGSGQGVQAGSSVRPPPGSAIRVASVSTLSGPIGSAVASGPRALQAWAAAKNASGGVDGHPIEVTVVDDGGDPSRHLALVRQMVEEREVVAFVHNAAPLSGQSSVAYLEQKGIPVIGTEGGSPWVNTSPVFFPQIDSDTFLADSFAGSMAAAGLPSGLKKIAVVSCAELQSCATAVRPKAFEAAGLRVVYQTQVSLAQPDYTAQCLGARNAGAELLFLAMDAQGTQRIADNCASVGFRPVIGHTAQSVSVTELSRPSLNGAVIGSPFAPWFQDSIPGVAEFRQAMAQHAPAVPADGSAISGWISGEVLARAIVNAADPATSAGILEGLHKISDDDIGGLTYPIAYPLGRPNNAGSQQGCFWLVRVQGGHFVSPDGGRRQC